MARSRSCFILPYMELPSGELVAALRIAKTFIRCGVDVDVLVPTIPSHRDVHGRFREFIVCDDGLSVKTLCLSEALYDHPTRGGVELLEALRAYCSGKRYDLFHGFGVNENAYLAALLARSDKAKFLVSMRGIDISREVVAHVDRANFTLHRADLVTGVSRASIETARLLGEFRFFDDPTYNAVESGNFVDGRVEPAEASPAAPEAKVIGAVGNFHVDSGVQDLVNAFLRISAASRASLLLVGELSSGPVTEAYLTSLIASRRWPITLTGWVPHREILRWVRAMDVVVCPSRMAGCPNKLLEAMSAAKATIATRVGANSEVLIHDTNGVLIDAGDPAGMEEALSSLLKADDRRRALGETAAETVHKRFGVESEQTVWGRVLAHLGIPVS